jgi:hypothetical protein
LNVSKSASVESIAAEFAGTTIVEVPLEATSRSGVLIAVLVVVAPPQPATLKE